MDFPCGTNVAIVGSVGRPLGPTVVVLWAWGNGAAPHVDRVDPRRRRRYHQPAVVSIPTTMIAA